MKNPHEVCFILLFNACAQLSTKEALKLVKQTSLTMPKSFYSISQVIAALIDALMKCGDVTRAEEWFNRSTIKDVFAYGAMMKGMIITILHQLFYVRYLPRLHDKRYVKKSN